MFFLIQNFNLFCSYFVHHVFLYDTQVLIKNHNMWLWIIHQNSHPLLCDACKWDNDNKLNQIIVTSYIKLG